jgi:hypothetical protein
MINYETFLASGRDVTFLMVWGGKENLKVSDQFCLFGMLIIGEFYWKMTRFCDGIS